MWDEEHPAFEVKELKLRHPNVLSFELQTGAGRYYIVGCYVPPSSLETLEPVRRALEDAPADERVRPMLWGDLNANLDVPMSFRDEAVADVVDGEDLIDISRHFRPRNRSRGHRGRWTWWHEREGRTITSRVDYLLCREEDRAKF